VLDVAVVGSLDKFPSEVCAGARHTLVVRTVVVVVVVAFIAETFCTPVDMALRWWTEADAARPRRPATTASTSAEATRPPTGPAAC